MGGTAVFAVSRFLKRKDGETKVELTPDTEITYVKGIGPVKGKAFNRVGINVLSDLLTFFPRSYEDRTVIKEINGLTPGETVCVTALVADTPRLSHIRKGLDLLKFRAVDATGSMEITFFNQAYLRDTFKPGESYTFYGKVAGTLTKPSMTNPVFEAEGTPGGVTGRIMPVYPLTAGLSQKTVAGAVKKCLEVCAGHIPEVLSQKVRAKWELAAAEYSYDNIHFPKDGKALEIARRRFIFEELYVFCCAMSALRGRRSRSPGIKIEGRSPDEFYSLLPFNPTEAQKRAVQEAFLDMTKAEEPMSRLVQGDVGSGKTVVAAACCWLCARSGHQAAFMAPTEILAHQHYNTLTELLSPFEVHVDLLVGSMTPKQKKQVYERLEAGETDIVIGTHAIISESVKFYRLGLVVTDEQHRFGVQQRSALSQKGDSPHVLVMSATPIPRTLALIIYGELDVSVIDELPPGRQKVDTFAVSESMRQRIYNFIRKNVSEGRQAYIVCPMVEDNEGAELKSAVEYGTELQKKVFPDLKVGIIHGKMKPAEKDRVMAEFVSGDTDILVATTVIEVGVDVPNATVMVVENADRFGLSQLHQLRGRVGRGEHKSYCILFNTSGGENAGKRLKIMCGTNDGFKIAEEDLKLRGPGDFFGSRQHGLPEFKIADLAGDMDVLKAGQRAAQETLCDDPELKKPENRYLRDRMEKIFETYSGGIN
jgi:ATP-dependent DNA helicase RecG